MDEEIEGLENLLKQLEDHLRERMKMFVDAGPGLEGNIKVDMQNTMSKIQKIKEDIDRKHGVSPNGYTIYFYVFCGTIAHVRNILGDELYSMVDEARYHQSDVHSWRPFKEGSTIEEILEKDIKSKGFSFETCFVNEATTDPANSLERITEIEQRIEKSIGIVDLLSVKADDITYLKPFDRSTVPLLLCPYCGHLSDPVRKHMNDIRLKTFPISEAFFRNKPEHAGFYMWDISVRESFIIAILNALQRLNITNKLKRP